jgi:hypothetical protein
LSLANAATGVKSTASEWTGALRPGHPQQALPCINLRLHQLGV